MASLAPPLPPCGRWRPDGRPGRRIARRAGLGPHRLRDRVGPTRAGARGRRGQRDGRGGDKWRQEQLRAATRSGACTLSRGDQDLGRADGLHGGPPAALGVAATACRRMRPRSSIKPVPVPGPIRRRARPGGSEGGHSRRQCRNACIARRRELSRPPAPHRHLRRRLTHPAAASHPRPAVGHGGLRRRLLFWAEDQARHARPPVTVRPVGSVRLARCHPARCPAQAGSARILPRPVAPVVRAAHARLGRGLVGPLLCGGPSHLARRHPCRALGLRGRHRRPLRCLRRRSVCRGGRGAWPGTRAAPGRGRTDPCGAAPAGRRCGHRGRVGGGVAQDDRLQQEAARPAVQRPG
mmetsp:Transcript_27656/g.88026  ORF Transcript_27656/g.88026 Transcript_27656/m.88026 type:complete len:351 (+) Transcript_27656:374-1426(+)